MKRRLDEGLALGGHHEASASDLSRKLGEPIEWEVAVEIPSETFHPLLFSRSRSQRTKYATTRSAAISAAAPAISFSHSCARSSIRRIGFE
jgi:hypothetical protein